MTHSYLVKHCEREHMQATTTLLAICATEFAARQHIDTNVAGEMADGFTSYKPSNRQAVRAALRSQYHIEALPFINNSP